MLFAERHGSVSRWQSSRGLSQAVSLQVYSGLHALTALWAHLRASDPVTHLPELRSRLQCGLCPQLVLARREDWAGDSPQSVHVCPRHKSRQSDSQQVSAPWAGARSRPLCSPGLRTRWLWAGGGSPGDGSRSPAKPCSRMNIWAVRSLCQAAEAEAGLSSTVLPPPPSGRGTGLCGENRRPPSVS